MESLKIDTLADYLSQLSIAEVPEASLELPSSSLVNPDPTLLCKVCGALPLSPQRCTTCDHFVCSTHACPVDGEHELAEPSVRKRAAFNKQMYKGCPNEGCAKGSTQMTQKALVTHLNSECQYSRVHCPKVGCSKLMPRSLAE